MRLANFLQEICLAFESFVSCTAFFLSPRTPPQSPLLCTSVLETMALQIALTVSAKLAGWSGLFCLAVIPEAVLCGRETAANLYKQRQSLACRGS